MITGPVSRAVSRAVSRSVVRRRKDGAPSPSLPVNLAPPSIAGTLTIGSVLTATPGTWTGADSVTGEWYVDGVATGDTDTSYTVLFADAGMDVDYRETATNPHGSTSETSNVLTIGAATLTQEVAAIFAAVSGKGYMIRLDSADSVFKNTDGTGAVTTVGDLIGYTTDLSGNGNHFTQATGANRPTYNGTGADFDGAGDGLSRAALDLSGSTHAYTVFVGQKTTGNNNAPILVHSTFVASNNGTVGITANGGSTVVFQYNARGITTQAQGRVNHANDEMASAVAHWDLTAAVNLSQQLKVWHNGVAQTVTGAATPVGPLTTQTHYIGSNGSMHHLGIGRRYLVLGTTVPLTTDQLNTLIAWAEEGRLGFP